MLPVPVPAAAWWLYYKYAPFFVVAYLARKNRWCSAYLVGTYGHVNTCSSTLCKTYFLFYVPASLAASLANQEPGSIEIGDSLDI